MKISTLFNSYWDPFYFNIRNKNYYLPSIDFLPNAIEFKDGIYFVNENKFYSFNKIFFFLQEVFSNIAIFSSKRYNSIKKPRQWLKLINTVILSPDIFCIDVAKIFKKTLAENQKFSLFDFILKLDDKPNKLNFDDLKIISFFFSNKEKLEIIIYCNRCYFSTNKINKKSINNKQKGLI